MLARVVVNVAVARRRSSGLALHGPLCSTLYGAKEDAIFIACVSRLACSLLGGGLDLVPRRANAVASRICVERDAVLCRSQIAIAATLFWSDSYDGSM